MVTQVKEPIIRLKDQNKPIREITLGVAKSVICDSSFPQLKKFPTQHLDKSIAVSRKQAYQCYLTLQYRDALMNVNGEGLQQDAKHWLLWLAQNVKQEVLLDAF